MRTTIILLLSVIQGITELLPISSSFHLNIVSRFLNCPLELKNSHFWLELGSGLAILYKYRSWFKQYNKLFYLFWSSIPIYFIVGLIRVFYFDFIILYNKYSSYFVIFGGIILMYCSIYAIYHYKDNRINLNKKNAYRIGIWQSLAIIPGMSRLGSTIIGGIFSGFDVDFAVDFAFFTSISMIPYTLKGVFNDMLSLQYEDTVIVLFGGILSFIITTLLFNYFLRFIISIHGMYICAIYRVLLGYSLII
jgi:undecaprenyl-diphosphatase